MNGVPTGVREAVVGALPGLTTEQVRVRVGDVGGGFGMKTGAYPEDLAVAHAARLLRRPVKWRADRIEEFLPDRMRITARLSTERAEGWVSPKDLSARVSLQNLFGVPAQNHTVSAEFTLAPAYPHFRAWKDYEFTDIREITEVSAELRRKAAS